jgi:hypothetical protein
MRTATAIESPRVAGDDRRSQVCFDDLAIARGYVDPRELSYAVTIRDDTGRTLDARAVAAVATVGQPSACVALDAARGQAYRVVEVTSELRAAAGGVRRAKPARIHVAGARVVGLERDE